ncbi:MAG TPA: GrpB family protein, partial [Trebonia sp.]|nr:GrpB family protein [Trebonia sp.]
MSDNTPPWAYELPEIHPHDPRLLEQAETERVRLQELLAPWIVDGVVEHVGSTSVPGLDAKPIIDLMAQVVDLDAVVDQVGETLSADGWQYVPPDLDRRPWRRFYIKPDRSGQLRYAHLHLIQAGHPRWAQQLEFRDALRRDDELAATYANLKRRLTAAHPHDREAYTEAKAEFIIEALRR